ncbi:hypothetical protein LJC14_04175 [Treponema sp. OttesenSCG-928-L16]|nr:hypothetical protein [Treponema sp. OttesenSCG-928-L16]
MRKNITSIIAFVCIVVYVAAIGYAAQGIYKSINSRRAIAEQEFLELADRAVSAGVLGFMGDAFQDALRDGVLESKTLHGVIVSGPYGNEYSFERSTGAITWIDGSPRFSSRLGLSREPFFAPLRIEGLRNVTISAVPDLIDYQVFVSILKNTLIIVICALALAALTLCIESLLANRRPLPISKDAREGQDGDYHVPDISPDFSASQPAADETGDERFEEDDSPLSAHGDFSSEAEEQNETPGPKGLYSPHGNISWEAYTKDRLASELHRCASFEQDLVFLAMDFNSGASFDASFYDTFAKTAVSFFSLRDLVFERNKNGISVIVPNMDLDQGFAKAEEFHGKIIQLLFESQNKGGELCIGLSSRSGRLIDAERLIFEASQALEKALEDPISPIVAFRSDPEKYRAFIAAQGK